MNTHATNGFARANPVGHRRARQHHGPVHRPTVARSSGNARRAVAAISGSMS